MMYSSEDLRSIYDSRYNNIKAIRNKREIEKYEKYKRLLLSKSWFRSFNNSKLLDLGCGLGHKTYGFSKNFDEVLGVDLSKEAIDVCKLLYENEKFKFSAIDAKEIDEMFDAITAFGFSLFNTSDNDFLVGNILDFYQKNLKKSKGNFIILGSVTDFSGTGSESWYLHSKEDLEYITHQIEEKSSLKSSIVFPHKLSQNYFYGGLKNFFMELGKLFLNRKKTFFIILRHE